MESKFEVGSLWRCRDGVKAEIVANDVNGADLLVRRSNTSRVYHSDGKFTFYENEWDLVEEWYEPMEPSYGFVIVRKSDGKNVGGSIYSTNNLIIGDNERIVKIKLVEVEDVEA
jgi:hypothetical protein